MSDIRKFRGDIWVEAKGVVTAEVRTQKCNYPHKLPLYMQDVSDEEVVEGVVDMEPRVRTQKCIYQYELNLYLQAVEDCVCIDTMPSGVTICMKRVRIHKAD